MMDWEAIGKSSIINFVLTTILIKCFSPLSILGPVIGGFIYNRISIYPNEIIKGSALSGVISGLILGIILTVGITSFTVILGIIVSSTSKTGSVGLIISLLTTLVIILINSLLSIFGAHLEKIID